MKCKVIAFFLCIVFACTLCLPVYADSDSSSNDGYSAIISDIPKVCPTCGSALHAFWFSTAGAEVELSISDEGKVTIPAGAGVFATINLKCKSCGYEKAETRLFGLDWGNEKPGQWEVKEAPSGIGRKDLPGYSDNNVPDVSQSGQLHFYVPVSGWCVSGNSNSHFMNIKSSNSWDVLYSDATISGSKFYSSGYAVAKFGFTAPVTGTYSFLGGVEVGYYIDSYTDWSGTPIVHHRKLITPTNLSSSSLSLLKGDTAALLINTLASATNQYEAHATGIDIYVIPASSTINKQTNVTINNNTWNGNIYTDNSTNLTYIYPQYTTINEKNETVTNISNTPIIYNNETKQYYTYDQTTKNYYYITYNTQPTPSPSPTPAPTDKPGGSISTPETGKPDGNSGSSWWDKLLDKLGNAVIDGLLGAVSAVLKLIFKLFSTILGWIIWAVSLVFTLFPFLPPGVSGLLVGGVVVCFVIGIIKFIRG